MLDKVMNQKTAEWYLMAGGVFFGGYLANVGVKLLGKGKPAVTMATIAGLLIGASLSAKALDLCKCNETNESQSA